MRARHTPLLALAGAVVWLYAEVAVGLVVQWMTSPDASYGVIVAAVGWLLLLERRAYLVRGTPTGWATVLGLIVLLCGLAAFIAGQMAADLFTVRASFILVAGGAIWFLSGTPAARLAVVPLAFLLLAIPLPELVVTSMTASLQDVASRMAEVMLVTGGIPVYRDGNMLELPASTLQVVEACSGMRSVVSLGSVGLLVAWAADVSWPRRLALIVATVPIAVAVNAVRLAVTGAAAERWGELATRDPWHSLLGWVAFVASLALLWRVRRAVFVRRCHDSAVPVAVGI